MPERRFVALCDILGFKSLVRTTSLDRLLESDLGFLRRIMGHALGQGEFPADPPQLQALRAQGRTGFAWFSDTVLIYGKDNHEDSRRAVLETVGWLLFESVRTRTRMRAGVAYGDFHADPENELFVGPAIVDAYELEQAQEWMGGALTPSAAEQVPPRTTSGARYQWWVCEYSVPLKAHSSVNPSALAINWTQGIHNPGFQLHWSRERAEPSEAERARDISLVLKWQHTREFHRAVCEGCFPENRRRHAGL